MKVSELITILKDLPQDEDVRVMACDPMDETVSINQVFYDENICACVVITR